MSTRGIVLQKAPALRRPYLAEIGPQPTIPIENKAPVSVVHRQKEHHFPIKTVLSILMTFCLLTVIEHITNAWKEGRLHLLDEVRSFLQYV